MCWRVTSGLSVVCTPQYEQLQRSSKSAVRSYRCFFASSATAEVPSSEPGKRPPLSTRRKTKERMARLLSMLFGNMLSNHCDSVTPASSSCLRLRKRRLDENLRSRERPAFRLLSSMLVSSSSSSSSSSSTERPLDGFCKHCRQYLRQNTAKPKTHKAEVLVHAFAAPFCPVVRHRKTSLAATGASTSPNIEVDAAGVITFAPVERDIAIRAVGGLGLLPRDCSRTLVMSPCEAAKRTADILVVSGEWDVGARKVVGKRDLGEWVVLCECQPQVSIFSRQSGTTLASVVPQKLSEGCAS